VLSNAGIRVSNRDEKRRDSAPREKTSAKPPAADRRPRLSPRQALTAAETEMERIGGIIAKIDAALALPDLFKRDPAKAKQLTQARTAAAKALQQAEEDWLAASATVESA